MILSQQEDFQTKLLQLVRLEGEWQWSASLFSPAIMFLFCSQACSNSTNTCSKSLWDGSSSWWWWQMKGPCCQPMKMINSQFFTEILTRATSVSGRCPCQWQGGVGKRCSLRCCPTKTILGLWESRYWYRSADQRVQVHKGFVSLGKLSVKKSRGLFKSNGSGLGSWEALDVQPKG